MGADIKYLNARAELQRRLDTIREQDTLIARLRSVADAARKMPRWTPSGGAANTKHTYQIEAADVWALDAALKTLDGDAERSKVNQLPRDASWDQSVP